MRIWGLPPGPDRDRRLFKKPFPPRAAWGTSGRSAQSASSFIKHLWERSLLDTRITFEIPPVTSQPPKHGSRGFKYLYVREGGREGRRGEGRPSVREIEMKFSKMCSWKKKKRGRLNMLTFWGLLPDIKWESDRISSQVQAKGNHFFSSNTVHLYLTCYSIPITYNKFLTVLHFYIGPTPFFSRCEIEGTEKVMRAEERPCA